MEKYRCRENPGINPLAAEPLICYDVSAVVPRNLGTYKARDLVVPSTLFTSSVHFPQPFRSHLRICSLEIDLQLNNQQQH